MRYAHGCSLSRLWTRELQALAEGRPLEQWTRPPGGVAGTGVWVEHGAYAAAGGH